LSGSNPKFERRVIMRNCKNTLITTPLVLLCFIILAAPVFCFADYIRMNPPPDVDKLDHNHWYGNQYKPTCWVATAANMLAGAGYGDGNNVQERADEIYDEMCFDILDCNNCGWTDTALSAWLRSADNNWKNTNPYKNITVMGESNWKNTREPWHKPDLPKYLGNELRNGATAQLSISNVSKSIGHSITGWGDDGNNTDTISENPTQVKVTDSDYTVWTQTVQTYTYDDYNNPNPGYGNNGVGWYFNYAYNDNHRYIDDITFLSSCPLTLDLNGTWGLTTQYVFSYKIRQDNMAFSAQGLRYKVNWEKIYWYRTDIDWDTNNPPNITEVNNPPTQLKVFWDLTDHPVPYDTNVTITTRIQVPWHPGGGFLNPVVYQDVNFSYGVATITKPGFGWHIDNIPIGGSSVPEPNATGGYVVGSFEIYGDSQGTEKIGEYRFMAEYDYNESPEQHQFFVDSNPQTYFVGKFHFGHSYASLENDKLWQFNQWMSDAYMYPPYPMLGTTSPITIDWTGMGLLPYPKGQDTIPPIPQRCGDPGTQYASGDINKDCKVDFLDFAELAFTWLTCTDPNQGNCL
jgi:hypothetical protein